MPAPYGDSAQMARLARALPRVTAEEARRICVREGGVLLDVREPGETASGAAAGAVLIPRAFVARDAGRAMPDRGRTVLVYCMTGPRSVWAAEALREMGYRDVRWIEGGYPAWVAAGLPVETHATRLTPEESRRYARHLAIPEVGEEGQAKLKAARVLLVGAGGLGSPAAVYLACAGVGTLGLVDGDVVDESNLQRQILHTGERVGMQKVESARRMLLGVNPLVRVETFPERLTSANVDRILPGFDVVIDGADNFPTRYLINDACVKHGRPDIHGSVFRFEGQVSVFVPGRGPCYRCLFPEPPPPGTTPSCAEAGVLGVLPGVVGLLQAIEAIKLILGRGDALIGRLLLYDALGACFGELKIPRNRDCAVCGEGRPFPGYVDYEGFCGGSASVE